jgi:hypothetical protein
MKLNQKKNSTQQQTFNKPNPPTVEMVEKAQFIDKTYHWKYADLRSGNGRLSKSSN